MQKILLLTVLAISFNVHAEINKCVIDGKVVYTDEECPDNTGGTFKAGNLTVLSNHEPGDYHSSVWLKNHSSYIRASKGEQQAPILIYAHTDWCGYCRKLEKLYFSDYEVKKVLAKFIKIKINPEKSSANNKFFASLGGTGYPSLYIKSFNGSIRYAHKPKLKGTRSLTSEREKFIEALNQYLVQFESNRNNYLKTLEIKNKQQAKRNELTPPL